MEFLKVLPELADKIASPLAKVDKITVISQDGASSGVNKITGDIAKIMAQIPELTQSLTGMNVTEALSGLLGRDKEQ